jgi:ADP-heptose:LPS heptosyltransferase
MGAPVLQLTGRGGERRDGEVRSVLVTRLDSIGDVVLTTPLLRELRRHYPSAWITLVVKPLTFNLVERCPYVNEVVNFDRDVRQQPVALRRLGRALRMASSHLWHRHFDLAIVPRWDQDLYDASVISFLSGARRRLGYSESVTNLKRLNNIGFDRLFTDLLDDDSAKHEVEHNLDLVRFLGRAVDNKRLELWVDDDDEAFALQLLNEAPASEEDMLLVFGVGADSPKRMWPLSRYEELGERLLRETRARIVITGGSRERDLGEQLQQRLGDRVLNAAGRTTLRQTAALFRRCDLFVGSDSGADAYCRGMRSSGG